MDMTPLERAVVAAGGQSALARILSTDARAVKQGHVWAWINRGHSVPAEFVIKIEAATGVSRHDLRPDVFGPAPANPDGEVADAA
ncbi:YdaS family helix-turn-helix protein [Xanthomonas sp. MWU16-30325]|uniref:YdaS family helix-turn-helix protein n=1 Tax=Xanthomonas sp. MWU16-30325 TaxID=2878096 RepID=UPI001CF9188F|nr:YdaS family helix-turn-helix protein [Xanthomonas sp. MWU16-30325]